ncbi:hypothetical protein HPP92_009793, partial [Vanilla planifolia]
ILSEHSTHWPLCSLILLLLFKQIQLEASCSLGQDFHCRNGRSSCWQSISPRKCQWWNACCQRTGQESAGV